MLLADDNEKNCNISVHIHPMNTFINGTIKNRKSSQSDGGIWEWASELLSLYFCPWQKTFSIAKTYSSGKDRVFRQITSNIDGEISVKFFSKQMR